MSKKTLCVIGDAMVDVIVPTKGMISGGIHDNDVELYCGGSANVAVGASRFGIRSKFVGKIGDTALGHLIKEDLKIEKIKDLTIIDHNNKTVICVSLIDKNGERTMITNRGANDHLSKEDLTENLADILNSDILYFNGHSFSSDLVSKTMFYLIEECKKREVELWVNPSAPNLVNSKLKRVLKNTDVLILNLDEGKTFTDKDEIDDICNELKKLSKTSVLTMGPDGCYILDNNHVDIFVPSPKVENVVDTTGAGDAFAGTFIAGRLKGLGCRECAEMAHKYASEIIQRKGAR